MRDALSVWTDNASFSIKTANVSLCLLVVLADVSEHNSNPAGENELRFVVGVFLLLT